MKHRPFRALVLLAAILVGLGWTLSRAGATEREPAPPPTPEIPHGASDPAYADACQVDFSFLRPTAPHGFLRVGTGGTFEWENGARARFWGINIANRSLWISHEEIDTVVKVIGRAGTNIVRFEALDSRGGLLDIHGHPGTRTLDPNKLDTLHYWIHKLKQRHIAYYLDLLDFREFTQEDGAEAVLNRGARPVAMFDTHIIDLQKEYATQLLTTPNPYTGLRPVDDPDLALLEICNEHGFFIKPEVLDTLVEPYRTRLQTAWNAWILRRYPTRAAISTSWKQTLADDEDPQAGTVHLPTLPTAVLADTAIPHGPHDVPQRLADGIQFLYEVQRIYFRTMVTHLRSIGLRIPVTAVVSNDIAPDLASVAAECDFLSENFYADHPFFDGNDWEGKYHFRNLNQLRDGGAGGFAPYTAALRWENKPVVIREWGTVWPNRYRAASVPQAVAYARLQDFDGMILFGYKTGEYANRLIFFGYEADPTVWGLYSLGAAMFLRGEIAPASSSTNLVYTPRALFSFPNGVTDTHRMAWIMRLNARVRDPAPSPTPDTHALRDLMHAVSTGPLVLNVAASAQSVTEPLERLGFSAASTEALLQSGVYTSSTGQITLDTKNGRLLVHAPNACIVAGELAGKPLLSGALSVETATEVGAVVALSLDGCPLAESRHYVVKMVSLAENTGQKLVGRPPRPDGRPDNILAREGDAPVRTGGIPSAHSTRVAIGGRQVVSIGMENGTWELYVNGRDVTFACDTLNVVANVLGHRIVTGRTSHGSLRGQHRD